MAFLGLDIGGSRARYVFRPESAGAGGEAAGSQPAVHGEQPAALALAALLRTAGAAVPVEAAVAGMAGVGDVATAARLVAGVRAAGLTLPLAVVSDVLAAAAGALGDGPGLLLWSGTGSFAVARSRNGGLVRVGGRGFLLSDQGSGYDLVRRAAAAVLLAEDGLGPATLLADALTAVFSAAPARLGAVLQRLDTAAVAARLGTVVEVAAGGDAVAQAVLGAGIEALALLADAAVRRAALAWPGLPVVLGGGALTAVPSLRQQLTGRLCAFGAPVPQLADALAAARGAAALAEAWHRRAQPAHTWVQHVAL
ncbi:MAG TPA: BadF/BadG/BcrA/BcrD ATPase family protein [Planctomycetota bacterium]|nr:BadF/BadG/BcrA/BcrD ATPase family protein [Planctomycetota bacterium]